MAELRNPLFPGEAIEYLGPGFSSTCHSVEKLRDHGGLELAKGNPGNLVRLEVAPEAPAWLPGSLLRKKVATPPR